MKKDILQKEVDQLAVVIAPREDHSEKDELWDTFLVNLYDEPISSVLVSSKGYGEIEGEKMSTTTLRHFFEEIAPQQMVPIEPIQPTLFQLTNEFWVSFVHEGYMYDKKYVFAKGSIHESKVTKLPFSDRQGVMLK
ncbi:hypothetical protein [Flavilitoribacter nigricans]|uniref:Uncharacterized protein n=1 Tax=Flavilitoribacter nigricans (strain ATCC 23147 / DSM 23189 / NBRC 102662 / NCIMB 1420 / SS-2) TaxID=1122177 RepID=A0A2D0N4H1_FLAN2|nr:hypothetical protein [Flavilitoribacter nigricans]PHN02673.1 hypothetical protein CRP01_31255 [Flavilitoribacter nigricans DSM 23189 = NBRC 102662]